jgi:transposase
MKTETIVMSLKEIERLGILQQLDAGIIKQKHAAVMLDISTRQVRNLIKKFREDGAQSLVSKHRDKKSNRTYSQSMKDNVLTIIKAHYADFRPTLASEYLLERHQIKIGKETVRKWMIEDGLWEAKKTKIKVVHQLRTRRGCYGELIQIDGSPHAWFEDRGEPCCLIIFIDDATSKIQLARFFKAETTFAYFEMIQEYIKRYGKPAELYNDKHGIFRVNAIEAKTGNGFTQFGRAMHELRITLHHASSAPAKGRVERANRTQQDRLIKWLRIEGISDIQTANQNIDRYFEKHNRQFAIQPREQQELHTQMDDINDLKLILTLQEKRSVSKNLTLQYKNKTYAIQMPGKGYRLRQAQVTVCEAQSGEITLLHNNKSLSYVVYDKNQYYSEPVSAKEIIHLNPHKVYRPDQSHPWKKKIC